MPFNRLIIYNFVVWNIVYHRKSIKHFRSINVFNLLYICLLHIVANDKNKWFVSVCKVVNALLCFSLIVDLHSFTVSFTIKTLIL